VFDMNSGRPLAGPPQRPLARVQLDVRRGVVYATGIEPRTV
jgi:Rieske Fe-S protein